MCTGRHLFIRGLDGNSSAIVSQHIAIEIASIYFPDKKIGRTLSLLQMPEHTKQEKAILRESVGKVLVERGVRGSVRVGGSCVCVYILCTDRQSKVGQECAKAVTVCVCVRVFVCVNCRDDQLFATCCHSNYTSSLKGGIFIWCRKCYIVPLKHIYWYWYIGQFSLHL